MASGPVPGAGPLGQDSLADAPHFLLRNLSEAGPRDGFYGGKNSAHEIGTAGPDVFVGGVDERLERDAQRLVAGHIALPELFQRVARILRARALRVKVGLLVAADGDVVLEH